METLSNLSEECPLKSPPFKKVLNEFYFYTDERGYRQTPYRMKNSEINKQISKWKALPKLLSLTNKWWTLGKVYEKHWVKGSLHNKKQVSKMGYMSGYPAHFHTDLTVFGEHFHIDFYGIAHWGPGSSLREIRVYKGEELIARGGEGNVFICGFAQNLPFVVPVEDSTVLFQFNRYRNEKDDYYDCEKVDLDISISLWHNCTNLTGHKMPVNRN